jgi:hypothetical protein
VTLACGVVVVELRGSEPLTACMPYTDQRPYHGPIRLLSCGGYCPLGTVVDRE